MTGGCYCSLREECSDYAAVFCLLTGLSCGSVPENIDYDLLSSVYMSHVYRVELCSSGVFI